MGHVIIVAMWRDAVTTPKIWFSKCYFQITEHCVLFFLMSKQFVKDYDCLLIKDHIILFFFYLFTVTYSVEVCP